MQQCNANVWRYSPTGFCATTGPFRVAKFDDTTESPARPRTALSRARDPRWRRRRRMYDAYCPDYSRRAKLVPSGQALTANDSRLIDGYVIVGALTAVVEAAGARCLSRSSCRRNADAWPMSMGKRKAAKM